ncbi:hypothetical protein [Mesorhizobium sp. YR577]|nr:hypothetical protein [Mesorhizobium sp. YR577]SFU16878.1 hypothetical protein SAMN05518861_11716 [Mesorhizobium sp. YR577]
MSRLILHNFAAARRSYRIRIAGTALTKIEAFKHATPDNQLGSETVRA